MKNTHHLTNFSPGSGRTGPTFPSIPLCTSNEIFSKDFAEHTRRNFPFCSLVFAFERKTTRNTLPRAVRSFLLANTVRSFSMLSSAKEADEIQAPPSWKTVSLIIIIPQMREPKNIKKCSPASHNVAIIYVLLLFRAPPKKLLLFPASQTKFSLPKAMRAHHATAFARLASLPRILSEQKISENEGVERKSREKLKAKCSPCAYSYPSMYGGQRSTESFIFYSEALERRKGIHTPSPNIHTQDITCTLKNQYLSPSHGMPSFRPLHLMRNSKTKQRSASTIPKSQDRVRNCKVNVDGCGTATRKHNSLCLLDITDTRMCPTHSNIPFPSSYSPYRPSIWSLRDRFGKSFIIGLVITVKRYANPKKHTHPIQCTR